MYFLAVIFRRFFQYIFSIERYIIDKINNSNTKRTIYFDLETTGLNPYYDNIIEYSFVKEDPQDLTYISELVNPLVKFENKITQITGIHPDELDDKPSINYYLPEIMHYINKERNVYLIAHNCDSFDKLFIINTIKNYNMLNPKNKISYEHLKFIDTIHLAKKVLPQIKNYSLKNLANYFNIKNGTHRALSDTICLREIYHELLKIIADDDEFIINYYLKHPEEVYAIIY